MGVRLHKAIGWAMSYVDFKAMTLLDIDHSECLSDELDRLLGEMAGPGLGLESKQDVLVSDLIISIGMDETDYVMFFPDAYYKDKWFRYNDALDWAFEMGHPDAQPDIEYMFLEQNPYPFNLNYMTEQGMIIPYHPHVDDDPSLLPSTPDYMREWLIRQGIFDITGIIKLRPMRVKWWS